MGFNKAKQQVLKCLEEGNIQHAERNTIDIKNLLAIGEISIKATSDILKRANGNDYSSSPHHFDKNIDVHIIKTVAAGKSWYIKWYFVEPDSIFISVHN